VLVCSSGWISLLTTAGAELIAAAGVRRAGWKKVASPYEGDDSILRWLAQRLQGVLAELGQLVEEEVVVVDQADPQAGRLSPPMRSASEVEWCGARKGCRAKRAWPAGRSPVMDRAWRP
jgi:hypothetical protein